MKVYVQQYDGINCLEKENHLVPIYETEACLNAAISNGCLQEGQIVAIPSCAQVVPSPGDACRTWLRSNSSGYLAAFTGVTNAWNAAYKTNLVYNNDNNTLCAGSFNATGNISSSTFNNNWTLSNTGVIAFNGNNILADYGLSCDITCAENRACTYAACVAKCCSETYFEDNISNCFDALIAVWWASHCGEVPNSQVSENNRIWVE